MSYRRNQDESSPSTPSSDKYFGGASNFRESPGGREDDGWKKVNNDRNSYRPRTEERPEHMRLKLAPKSDGQTATGSQDNNADKTTGDDKWSKVFANSTSDDNRPRNGGPMHRGGSDLQTNSRWGSSEDQRQYQTRDSQSDRRDFREGSERREYQGERREYQGERRDPRDGDRRDFAERVERREYQGGERRERRDYGDRRDAGERREYNDGGRGGGFRGGRRDRDDEPITDPRFAGKFNSAPRNNGPPGGGGGFGRRESRPVGDKNDLSSLPTAPRASLNASQPNVPSPTVFGPSLEELKRKDEEAAAAKKAKAAAREEAEKQAKLQKEKEKREAEEAKQRELDAKALAGAAAGDLLATGLKGKALADQFASSTNKPTAASFVSAILKLVKPDSAWVSADEYGPVLKKLLPGKEADQVAVLYAVQEHCSAQSFPVIEVKGASKRLVEYLFVTLLNNLLVDAESFVAWADDEKDNDIPGRNTALVQTNEFLTKLRNMLAEPDEEEGEEEEEDEVDAPREVWK